MKTIVAFTTLALATSMTFASDAARDAAKEMVPLRDGGTLFVFKDGTMAKQDAYGNAKYIKKGDVLEAADGKKIPVTSNEVARMHALTVKGHQN
ncbi:CopK family periplasmic copper-binding protein [Hydrogenophaga aquatica]